MVLSRIEFPPSAYLANVVVEETISLPLSVDGTIRSPKMFGVSLETVSWQISVKFHSDDSGMQVMDGPGGLPRAVSDCLDVIKQDRECTVDCL